MGYPRILGCCRFDHVDSGDLLILHRLLRLLWRHQRKQMSACYSKCDVLLHVHCDHTFNTHIDIHTHEKRE